MIALLAALLAPAGAQAHAQLEATVPAGGAVVRQQPRVVELRFGEPVQTAFGSIRVVDPRGRRVDAGAAFHPRRRDDEIAVALRRGQTTGTYTASWSVVSADGHVVGGGFTFSVGHPTAVVAAARPPGGGAAASTTQGVARGVQFGAIGVGIGTLLFLFAVWLPAIQLSGSGSAGSRLMSRRALAALRRLVLAAAVLGALSGAAAVALEGAEALGGGIGAGLHASVLRETLSTRFGAVWALAVLAWLIVGAAAAGLLAPGARRAPVLRPAELGAAGAALGPPSVALPAIVAVPAAWLLVLPSLGGHASSLPASWALVPANVAHVAAMAAWCGGLAALLVLQRPLRALTGGERSQMLSAVLHRFSPVALASVLVLLATGTVQALVELPGLSAVWTTAFGREVLLKVALLAVLMAIGAYHQRRSLPGLRRLARRHADPGARGRATVRALAIEVALILGVLGVTAALSGTAPRAAIATAARTPPAATAAAGPARVRLAMGADGRPRLTLTNRRTGAPLRGVKEVDVAARQPTAGIGPLRALAHAVADGRYRVDRLALTVPGTWVVEVAVRVSAFDEYDARLHLSVPPGTAVAAASAAGAHHHHHHRAGMFIRAPSGALVMRHVLGHDIEPDIAHASPRARSQARALLRESEAVARSRFPTLQAALAAGYRFGLLHRRQQAEAIRRGTTSVYHLTNLAYMADGRLLDPERPESLVYRPLPDGRMQLVALMFRAPSTQRPPDVAHGILFWHIHGLRLNKGQRPPRYRPGKTIMAHVWLDPDLRRAFQTEMP